MNRFRFFLLSLMLVLGTAACERELEIPFPDHTPQLVANSLTVSGEPFHVVVSRSFTMEERVREADIYLTDATVGLWQDGEFLENMFLASTDSAPRFGYYSEHIAQPGSQYELRITHPDYPALRQEMVLPSLPQIQDFAFASNTGISNDGYQLNEISFQLNDPADTANYYALRSLFRVSSSDPAVQDALYLFSWEPTLVNSSTFTRQGFEMLSDEIFDGQTTEITFEADDFGFFGLDQADIDAGYLVLETYSFNEAAYRMGAEYYEHLYSRRFIDFDLSVLSQSPLPMYSNAEGGFGIFAGYSVRTDTLRW